LEFCLQVSESLWFVVEKNLILAVDGHDDGFFLIRRGFYIGLGKFHNDSGFSHRIEGIDQTEGGEEEDEDVEDNIREGNRFQGNH
jgi:hypothetical protein